MKISVATVSPTLESQPDIANRGFSGTFILSRGRLVTMGVGV